MEADDKIKEMLKRAGNIHAGVNQLFDIYPYVFHLQRVLNAVLNYMDYIPELNEYKYILTFAACYHDTIEDARLTYNDVVKEASKFLGKEDAVTAAEIVYALTNEKGRTRAERANAKYYEGIRTTPFAVFVKMCDRLANASYAIENGTSMAKKYRQEMPDFISHLYNHREVDLKYTVPTELVNDLLKL